jgi:hypothetical protein
LVDEIAKAKCCEQRLIADAVTRAACTETSKETHPVYKLDFNTDVTLPSSKLERAIKHN